MEYYKNLDLQDIVYFCEVDLIEKTEQWKDIIGFEKMYQISNLGRIKSLSRITYKKTGSFRRKESISKQSNDNSGYLVKTLYNKPFQKTCKTHRLVAIHFIPNPYNKPEVNHKDGDKANNYKGNLEWNTSSENQFHAFRNNLQISIKGQDHYLSKLTKEQVLEIRKSNLSQVELASLYGVTNKNISCIILRKTWKHI